MKQLKELFNSVPVAARNAAIGVGAMVSAGLASAADSAIVTGATNGLQTAQSGGETVGGQVVIVVAALCLVGIVIGMVRKA